MDSQFIIDFGAFLAVWVALSPLLISALKNIGGNWPNWLKVGVSVAFAVVGAVFAFASAEGLGAVDVFDAEFIKALVIGVILAFGGQYAIWKAAWQGGQIETNIANFTPLNKSTSVETFDVAA